MNTMAMIMGLECKRWEVRRRESRNDIPAGRVLLFRFVGAMVTVWRMLARDTEETSMKESKGKRGCNRWVHNSRGKAAGVERMAGEMSHDKNQLTDDLTYDDTAMSCRCMAFCDATRANQIELTEGVANLRTVFLNPLFARREVNMTSRLSRVGEGEREKDKTKKKSGPGREIEQQKSLVGPRKTANVADGKG